jgi:hypothetical protein
MSKSTVIASAIFSSACVVLLAFTLGASPASEPSPGRFQMVANENHVFILDTATGQAWEKFVTSNQGVTSDDFAKEKLSPRQ